ncbi:unnamed protein product [Ambrosiozyma monospora]|uniref:Unnamed protein product n=1 Tax=Ambrosiozyma monospora TaxID=43982 RepID=A0ACB5T1L9_AMBMO|nr:unnamed protein product [Ambrosiozyma monospora]
MVVELEVVGGMAASLSADLEPVVVVEGTVVPVEDQQGTSQAEAVETEPAVSVGRFALAVAFGDGSSVY